MLDSIDRIEQKFHKIGFLLQNLSSKKGDKSESDSDLDPHRAVASRDDTPEIKQKQSKPAESDSDSETPEEKPKKSKSKPKKQKSKSKK